MILTNLLLGPLLLFFTIIFKIFPAKNINGLYGYRTSRSMKSQQSWDAANKYAFNLMLWVAIITCIAQLILYYTISPANTVLSTCIIMCALLIIVIPITESFLKKNFDDEGNPIKN